MQALSQTVSLLPLGSRPQRGPFRKARPSNMELCATAIPSGDHLSRFSGSRDGSGGAQPLQEADPVPDTLSTDSTSQMMEYDQLKQRLLKRAKQGSGFLALYIFLQQGLVATGCSLVGSVAGYAYLQSLMQAVDSYTAESDVPLVSAREVANPFLRALAITSAVYGQAISGRLLIPTILALGIFLFNNTQPQYFTLTQEFDILLGFLFSYKSGLVSAFYDEIKPKVKKLGDENPVRPTLAALPDPDEERRERLLAERRRR